MTTRDGRPIWYELMSADPDAARAFYDDVVGWSVGPTPADGPDYRIIDTGGGGQVGGVMRLTDEMRSGGARPGWLFYIAVADVDATAATVTAAGGGVLMPAWTYEGVGRMALLHDPQGAPFYVMRPAADGISTAWDPTGTGTCGWNELTTDDQAGALAFYGQVFG